MAQLSNHSIVLSKRPKEFIIPGETFALDKRLMLNENNLESGQILVKKPYLSIDLAMRAYLNDSYTPTYMAPLQIGEVMRGAIIGKVVGNKASAFDIGAYVSCNSGWTEFAVVDAKDAVPLELPQTGKLTDALGLLGNTGMTAYFGILNIGQVKSGDFVVVSDAAGATGSIVCQIAKLQGARVLEIAGSDDKVAWSKELGCDDALNYKNTDFARQLKQKTAGSIDVFFHNVRGEIMDLALAQAKPHARFVMYGGIIQYNSADPIGPKNILSVVISRVKMQGFLIFDYVPRYPEAQKALTQWLLDGKLQRKETIIKGGLIAAEQGLIYLYNGINTGKLLVEVAADE
ncbi:hypothetical protein BOTCAL_0013g00460 [Botryotinia calthae]|uniref:Enoyl reductase (ER) domain-containing protein n=1 Tax=Botryotinia calthae TaxID=38488 RepID=A0A4Y8DG55_9HELO|nr:hypothetical protein BOTCAL_0013g00460 [Botryotinia calthae]